MDGQVRVQLAEEGADPERLQDVTALLRKELRRLDVDDVAPARAGQAPEGARAFDVMAVGGLLISLGNSQALRSVVATVRGWLGRTPGVVRSVKLEIDGDVLELSNATAHDQERLVELFLSRHDPGGPTP